MSHRKLTNIHIRLNWDHLGQYQVARARRHSRGLRLAHRGRRLQRDILPGLHRGMKQGGLALLEAVATAYAQATRQGRQRATVKAQRRALRRKA